MTPRHQIEPSRQDLLSSETLAKSAVVANCCMNRERGLEGRNSYTRDLGFHPLGFLRDRIDAGQDATWLDLCCGTGRALIAAAADLQSTGLADKCRIIGLDLVDAFDSIPAEIDSVRLFVGSVEAWAPRETFDLITCVHGLHYVGDKLGLLTRAAAALRCGGRFAGHLDFANLRDNGGDDVRFSRAVRRWLRDSGFVYSKSRRVLRLDEPRTNEPPWRFSGSRDDAGPNYTGQRAVDSYYHFSGGASTLGV